MAIPMHLTAPNRSKTSFTSTKSSGILPLNSWKHETKWGILQSLGIISAFLYNLVWKAPKQTCHIKFLCQSRLSHTNMVLEGMDFTVMTGNILLGRFAPSDESVCTSFLLTLDFWGAEWALFHTLITKASITFFQSNKQGNVLLKKQQKKKKKMKL